MTAPTFHVGERRNIMCVICKASEFQNNPVHKVPLAVSVNGVDVGEQDFTKDFTLVATYRAGIEAALGKTRAPLCDNHSLLMSMMTAMGAS
jgi:hypothetical protein